MAKTLQAIRGMNDIKPEDTPVWQYVENTLRTVLGQYGFQEIRTPVPESTRLFQRSVGEHTDIVEKEMYTFCDRNEESLTLRPEFTAGIVRAGIEHGLFYNRIQRLWTMGPLFRYERPQKGRYRQFYQLSVESFGMAEPEADAELIFLLARLWKTFGINNILTLELNTLGSYEERMTYRDALVEYFTQHEASLDADSKRRLKKNPLRILDSKAPEIRSIVENAPEIRDFLGEQSRKEFSSLCSALEHNDIPFTVNQRLVRGLDYYNKTVFEWTTDALGAQGTVCGGGRYDRLNEMLGGKPVPACGFGMGMERLILLLQTLDRVPADIHLHADIAVVAGSDVSLYAMKLTEKVRDCLPELKVLAGISGSFKSQMKRADRSGAKVALIIGEKEAVSGQVSIKYLRKEDKGQETLDQESMITVLKQLI